MTAHLSHNYRAPTLANRFYVLRAEVDDSKAQEKSGTKLWIKGVVEDAETGKVCVEASGLFVVPKGINLPQIDG